MYSGRRRRELPKTESTVEHRPSGEKADARFDLEVEENRFALYFSTKCSCGDPQCEWSLGATIDRYYQGEQVK